MSEELSASVSDAPAIMDNGSVIGVNRNQIGKITATYARPNTVPSGEAKKDDKLSSVVAAAAAEAVFEATTGWGAEFAKALTCVARTT